MAVHGEGVDTEEMRGAMVEARELFRELVGAEPSRRMDPARGPVLDKSGNKGS